MARLAPLFAAALLAALPARAADTVRVAKAVGSQFVYAPLDVGIELGLFAKYGIAVELSTMTGEARLQQGLIAASVDVGLAGNSGAALSAKGAPLIAVAAYVNAPRNFAVVVLADSPIKTVADLRGKLVSGATTGGLPEWLVKRLAVVEGWGADGIRSISVGSPDASLSALRTHQVDAMMTATATGILLEEQGSGRIVTEMGEFAANFHTSLVFARTEFAAQSPDTLARFLKGLYASVAFVKANKDKTVAIASHVLNLNPTIVGRVYDIESPILSDDGHFDPQAIDALKQSFIEMGSLSETPRDDQILTTKFVPVRP